MKPLIRTFIFSVFLFVCTSLCASNKGINLLNNTQGKLGQQFNLLANSPVKITLYDYLQSGVSQQGQQINFQVTQDVCDSGGNILIKKGAPAYGTVITSRARGYFSRKGELGVSIDFTSSVDGQNILLKGQKRSAGGGNGTLGVAATIVSFPLTFGFTGLMKGSNIQIKPGTQFDAFTGESVYIAPLIKTAKETTITMKSFVMKDGSKISGAILEYGNGTYRVKTNLGVANISDSEVQSISAIQ